MIELSVVVPVYSCAGCLRELHRRLTRSVGEITSNYELIFVDDASTDGAWEVLSELASTDPAVRAFGLARNFGQDAAITAGLSKSRGTWTIVMDCDLQEAPEDLPRLYAKAMEGYELVRTTRARRGHSRARRAGSRIYRRMLLQGRGIEYSNMSLLSRRVVDTFLLLEDRDREYTLVLDWMGFTQAVVEVEFHDRTVGESAYTLSRLAQVALNGMYFRTTVLLRIVVFIGFLIAIAGVGLAAYNVIYYFAHGQPKGYTSLMVLIVLMGGFIITSVGIVGLYVGRVFEQVKARPLFIISREAGGEDELSEEAVGPERAEAGPSVARDQV